MALLTFTSDFGYEDHYVASVKAAIYKVNPSLQIVDISHAIKRFDIEHGAFVLSNVFRDFPEGTVHLIGIDDSGHLNKPCIAFKLEQHFFVSSDCGIIGLLSDNQPEYVVELPEMEQGSHTFLSKKVLAKISAQMASGVEATSLGRFTREYHSLLPRRGKASKKQIAGHVIRVDNYGNLITNISGADYRNIQKINGDAPFEVVCGAERFRKIQHNYGEVAPGECFVIFNDQDKLEVGINKGNASQLLGVKRGTMLVLNFLTS